jgi:hypothetical protein
MIALSGCMSTSSSESSEESSNGLENSGMVQHVSWLDQSAVYEVNIRQYTKEGTFRAFAEHLPRLKKWVLNFFGSCRLLRSADRS